MQVNFVTMEEHLQMKNELLKAIAELEKRFAEKQSGVDLNKKLLTTTEVRKTLRCSNKTIERRRIDGSLRSEFDRGRHYHYTEDVVKLMHN